MTKYLDLNGLSYFWSKIVSKLNLKANVLRTKLGQNNEDDPNDDYLLMVGNGVDSSNKKTVFSVDNDGNTLMSDLKLVADSNEEAEINFKTSYNDHPVVKLYGATDEYGDAVLLGGGGAMVVGSGESADNLYAALGVSPGDEKTYIASDGEIEFYSNCNTIADRRKLLFDTDLKLYNGSFRSIHPTIDRDAANPSSDQWGGLINLKDKDGENVSAIVNVMKTNGKIETGLVAYNENSGTEVNNSIYLGIDKSGNRSYSVSDGAAFRNAIGASSGLWPVSVGGTGISSNPSMLVNLASTSAANVFAASPRPGITGTLPKGHGGTGITDLGDIKSVWGSDVNIASGATGTLCSLSIPAGRWVVVGAAVHPGGGSGWYFAINITTGSSVSGRGAMRVNNQNGSVYLVDTCILNLSSATTYKLVASHNQGSTKACAGSIYAIKIG